MDNYKHLKTPVKLFLLMDKEIKNVFITLLTIAFYKKSNEFQTSLSNLVKLTNMSKKVIIACLSTLHRKNIVKVSPNKNDKGLDITSTFIINEQSFEIYDKYKIKEIFNNPSLKIVKDNYREKGFKPSYHSTVSKNEVDEKKVKVAVAADAPEEVPVTVTTLTTREEQGKWSKDYYRNENN